MAVSFNPPIIKYGSIVGTQHLPFKTNEWVDVKSSNIRAFWYDPNTLELRVDMSGGKYSYKGVPLTIVTEFFNSPSKGAYHNAKIRGKGNPPKNPPYAYTQIS